MSHYHLIVGSSYSLSNESDCDVQSDYFPGMWAIRTQKAIVEYAEELLSEGNTVEVVNYDSPHYYGASNRIIKKLGLTQSLFS